VIGAVFGILILILIFVVAVKKKMCCQGRAKTSAPAPFREYDRNVLRGSTPSGHDAPRRTPANEIVRGSEDQPYPPTKATPLRCQGVGKYGGGGSQAMLERPKRGGERREVSLELEESGRSSRGGSGARSSRAPPAYPELRDNPFVDAFPAATRRSDSGGQNNSSAANRPASGGVYRPRKSKQVEEDMTV